MTLAPRWTVQTSGVNQRLRGVSAVSEQVAWASGAGSTILRTADGGLKWQNFIVSPDTLDFRDIDAIDAQTAYVMSIGNGSLSRIYKTTDAGTTWKVQFRNKDPKAFLDAMSFWDANHGIAFGDSVDKQFYILTTADGRTWSRVPATNLPPAQENEGAFAASGTNIALFGKSYAWIGTGAAAKSRVLRTTDGGETWTQVPTNVSFTLLSIQFLNDEEGWAVGRGGVILRSSDEGKTWVRQDSTTKQNLYSLNFNKKTGWAVGGEGIVLRCNCD